jgi:hypothetical protein
VLDSPSLLSRTRGLVTAAAAAYAGGPFGGVVTGIAGQLDQPLRVALAGRVKAGKSTLINGLIGQELAATDAGECTRIVTWFQNGNTYRITLHPTHGPAQQLPFVGSGSMADIDLRGHTPASVDRLVVDWPSQRLRTMTLIDTPGMGSVDSAVSARAREMLAPDAPYRTGADAVIYLMRHVHGDDVQFLETFHGGPGPGKPVNTVGVLARADEVGHSRATALESARRIAARYQADPRVRRLCHSVIPVAGLLASFAATLREVEYQALRQISALPEADRARLLLSTDRFISLDAHGAADPKTRIELLKRIGLFGVRQSVELIATGQVRDATGLSGRLMALSGIEALNQMLAQQFGARAEVLKARTALLALEGVFRDSPPPLELERQLEEVRAGAHELTEVRLIDALREDPTLFRPEDALGVERLLGAHGTDTHSRLGLAPGSAEALVRGAAFEMLARWQREAEDPISTRETKAAARILMRTCEGMIAAVQQV